MVQVCPKIRTFKVNGFYSHFSKYLFVLERNSSLNGSASLLHNFLANSLGSRDLIDWFLRLVVVSCLWRVHLKA